MEYVCSGNRLPKVDNCPKELYQMMLRCWEKEPTIRPSFKEILDFLVVEEIAINSDELSQHHNDGSDIYKIPESFSASKYQNKEDQYQYQ